MHSSKIFESRYWKINSDNLEEELDVITEKIYIVHVHKCT